jgi:hypothetical protein
MKRMRRVVRKDNVFWWLDSFLKAGATLGGRSSGAFEKRGRSAVLQSAKA